ncbi:MAG: hypothetical protein SGARI_007646, partial [Bacillariaceae sp.]
VALCKCIVDYALKSSNANRGESTGDNDWLSLSIGETLHRWNVPGELRPEAWAKLGVAVVALSTLGASFPGDDPGKLYSIIQCASIALYLSMKDLGSHVDMSRKMGKNSANPAGNNGVRDNASESKDLLILLAAMEEVEVSTTRLSSLCRARIMQNRCFPLASSALECMKSYARLLRGQIIPKKGEAKQTSISSHFVPQKAAGAGGSQ